ncbi:TnsA endonuclease N-terminal domain-containing protein [Burkholderia multivorans]|uniref:TnsA endonuclease N-terminal domain-containing protein n=1 Tax=Burkholderia multivorans TaxID=87883 RepID=UPI001CC2F275|nr:TnsA endonuclease N-terminal domain-containing protein [Burkholderia multivorans]UQN70238.1 TnsA endonuclease N-terminal domain-containing protein [Burkholderia multivorans]UQN75968.1 TnsA endonuclease N-terminal domain-containing protein [Burkholderia multivorans]
MQSRRRQIRRGAWTSSPTSFRTAINPDSRAVCSYYPDFIFQREEPDGSLKYVIVEVKADNQIEDAVVQAKKDFAQQIAVASGMEYRILKSSDADKRHFRVLL